MTAFSSSSSPPPQSSTLVIVTAALLSTIMISFIPNLVLLVFPNYGAGNDGGSPHSMFLLSLGQALSAGALLGDVFLHTLPDTMGNANSTNHHHGGTSGSWLILGFTLFLATDLIVRSSVGAHHDHHQEHHSSHQEDTSLVINDGYHYQQHKYNNHEEDAAKTAKPNGLNSSTDNNDNQQSTAAQSKLLLSSSSSIATTNRIASNRSTVFLNLLADSMHNFTDGIAIGATYAAMYVHSHQHHHHHNQSIAPAVVSTRLTTQQSSILLANNYQHDFIHFWIAVFTLVLTSRGGMTSLAIVLHEIPHELGDFCTLIRAGYSKSQAIMAQFMTAIMALFGTLLALLVTIIITNHSESNTHSGTGGATARYHDHQDHQHHGAGSDQLLLITAGGFLYLAASTIIPELIQDQNILYYHQTKSPKSPIGTTWKTIAWLRLMQLLAFCTGVMFLYIVAYLEGMGEDKNSQGLIHEHHHHDHSHHTQSLQIQTPIAVHSPTNNEL